MELDERLAGRCKKMSRLSFAVVRKLTDGQDAQLKAMVFSALWEAAQTEKRSQYEARASREKEALRRAGQRRHAATVLGKLTHWADLRCYSMIFQSWLRLARQRQEEVRAELAAQQAQAGLSKARAAASERIIEHSGRLVKMREELFRMRVLEAWRRMHMLARMQRYARDQNTKKRQQLQGVKGLFRSFAEELGEELRQGTPRLDVSSSATASAVESQE
eukprot:TRINITY_DN27112_c0_g1_i1.p2 TRINITY_DN27112_c0_g1~~TRINITY_DN27112_c0_g1_i1.p2  ORF type:complete len:247 (+),score=53.12 TRINITY_DN27112_c0_g1_i1:85-741(+)